MALVTTMLQQKYCLEIEECSYKMKSESGVIVWDSRCIYVLAGQYSFAGFGGKWKIDASDRENEKPYL